MLKENSCQRGDPLLTASNSNFARLVSKYCTFTPLSITLSLCLFFVILLKSILPFAVLWTMELVARDNWSLLPVLKGENTPLPPLDGWMDGWVEMLPASSVAAKSSLQAPFSLIRTGLLVSARSSSELRMHIHIPKAFLSLHSHSIIVFTSLWM